MLIVGRYDFFYKNGVPRWRGTGYYYSRYRPGLGVRSLQCSVERQLTSVRQSAVIFLILVTTGLHYLVQRINYRSDLARIERVVREARLAAWGPKLVPLEGQRKVRHPFTAKVE